MRKGRRKGEERQKKESNGVQIVRCSRAPDEAFWDKHVCLKPRSKAT